VIYFVRNYNKIMVRETIDPRIKEEINKEGFEAEDEESGSAVLIGKEEEMPRLLDKLEKESRAKNLGAYIRMHKVIAVPKNEIPTEHKELLGSLNAGIAYVSEWRSGGLIIRYIDRDHNIATVELDPQHTGFLAEKDVRYAKDEVKSKLRELGFTITEDRDTQNIMAIVVWKQIQKIDKELKENKDKFDF